MQSTSGYGVNAKFGFIVRPIENSAFRLGLAVETPTFYTLETVGDMYVDTHYDPKGIYDNANLYRYYGPEDNYLNYTIRTPWKLRVSAGHTIGDFFAIGAEYEYVNYSLTNMGYVDYDSWGGTREDQAMNEDAAVNLKTGHNFKFGMEFKLTDCWTGRVGYNYYSTAYEQTARMSQYLDSYALNYSTYTDYMNKNINSENGKIGLPEEVYNLKPAKQQNFEFSYKIEEFKEPQNIIEEIRGIFEKISMKLELIASK